MTRYLYVILMIMINFLSIIAAIPSLNGKNYKELWNVYKNYSVHSHTHSPVVQWNDSHLSPSKVWVWTLLMSLRIFHWQGVVIVPLEQGDGGVWDMWEVSALPIELSLWALRSFGKGNGSWSQVQRVILQTMVNNTHTHTHKHTHTGQSWSPTFNQSK